MERLAPGDPPRIGAYRLLGRLGAGGMGHVYLARSDRGRTVAVKFVRQELARQEEFRARFRQEVQAARRVGGLWTAPVLDADTEAEIPWVATGYVAGPTLQTVVGQDHGALPERSVRILAAGLAHALRDIHAAGLIHRDLKPSNVLVTIDGPRVIDFGIARALETVTDGGLTRTGALVGSPGFMAPEQVRGDRITPACDIFCLGSVLAYAASGTLPFGTANSGVHALMFRIAQEEPNLERLPEGLADLVRDCLRKVPEARPSLEDILERTGAEDTVMDGRALDPWLPGSLVAQLGRHAVALLDTEDPEEERASGPGDAPAWGASAGDALAGDAAEGASTAVVNKPVDDRANGAAPSAGPAPGPEGSPEHAPAPDADGTAAPPPPDASPFDRLPTQVAGPTPPSNAPPGYGHPQQHPQPGYSAGWGTAPGYGPPPGPTPPYGATSPYGPTPPYGPASGGLQQSGAPRRRSGRSTAALIVVALIVALGAGGSVYALMKGGGSENDDAGQPTSGAPTTPGPTDSDSGAAPSTPTTEPPTGRTADGAVPEGFLGTWNSSIDNATGHNSRQLVIRQGAVGDTILSLTADGPAGAGTYHCVFEAELTAAPTTDGPLQIGPSTVKVGEPASSCTPGSASEIALLTDGTLRRVNTSNGESLTYTKSG